MAVDGFFVLSGFLVAGSFDRASSLGRFLWFRFLRIMPAFWLTLALTAFVVAPAVAALEGHPPASVFTGELPSWRYLTDNFALYIPATGWMVAGLPTGTATPGVINGALWTLFYEAVCYVMVAVLGVVGLLRRRRWLIAVAAGGAWLGLLANELAPDMVPGDLFLRFFWIFLLGVLAHVYVDVLPMTVPLVVASAVVVVIGLLTLTDYRVLAGPAFAYLCLWAMVGTPWLRRRLSVDLSYGMYVFHWPIEVLLVSAGALAIGQVPYTVLAVALAGAAAYLSWRFVEKPALSGKNMPAPRIPEWVRSKRPRVLEGGAPVE